MHRITIIKTDTALKRANPPRARIIYPNDMQVLLDRIENWRRFYRPAQRILAVPYYTPPIAGEVMQDERVVNLPVDMHDAVILEQCWRNLANQPKKSFLKLEYILKAPQPVIWRKLKKMGERIVSQQNHLLFNRATLEYFQNSLEHNQWQQRSEKPDRTK